MVSYEASSDDILENSMAHDPLHISPPRNGRGPRILVPLGGAETSLTISEATDLYRRIGDALLVAAKRHGDIDPRIIEDEP